MTVSTLASLPQNASSGNFFSSLNGNYCIPFALGVGVSVVAFAIFSSCGRRAPSLPPEIAANLDHIFDEIASARNKEELQFKQTLAKGEKACKEELLAKTQQVELLQKRFEQEKASHDQELEVATKAFEQQRLSLSKKNEELTREALARKQQITLLEETQADLLLQQKKAASSYAGALLEKEEERRKIAEELVTSQKALHQTKILAEEQLEQCRKQQRVQKQQKIEKLATLTQKYEKLAQELIFQKHATEEIEQSKKVLLLQIQNSRKLIDQQLQEKEVATAKMAKELAACELVLKQQKADAKLNAKKSTELQQTLAKTQQLLIDVQTSSCPSHPPPPSSSSSASTTVAPSIVSKASGEQLSSTQKVDRPILLGEGRAYYVGPSKDGLPEGTGILIYPHQSLLFYYCGAFKKGLRHGKGTLQWQGGKIYRGDFENDHMQGKGLLQYALRDKSITYRGNFRNDLYHGEGVLRTQSQDGEIIYEGSFQNGQYSGTGVYTRTRIAGDKEFISTYVGVFENDHITICESSKETSRTLSSNQRKTS